MIHGLSVGSLVNFVVSLFCCIVKPTTGYRGIVLKWMVRNSRIVSFGVINIVKSTTVMYCEPHSLSKHEVGLMVY